MTESTTLAGLTVTATKKPKSTVELFITLPADMWQGFVDRAIKRLTTVIEVPGFRKGKVPPEMVREKLSAQAILEEAAEETVTLSFAEAVEREQLTTIGSPKIEITKLAEHNPFEYKATVALVPDVTVGGVESLAKIERKAITITEEDLMKTLDQLRDMRRTEIATTEAAQKGDKVELDLDVFRDGVPIDGGSSKNHPIVIGESNFIPGFENELIGLKPSDAKTFTLKFPEDYHQKNLAGQPCEFRVKANTVLKLSRPEVNDEFAKSVGSFTTVKELKEKISENIHTERAEREEQRFEQALLEHLIEKSQFGDIPEVLIDEESEKMLEELEHDITHRGLKFEDYLTSLKKSRPELKLEFTAPAIKRVKSALLMRALAKQENVQVNDAEIEAERARMREQYASEPEALEKLLTPEVSRYLVTMVTNRKVIEWLKSKATPTQ